MRLLSRPMLISIDDPQYVDSLCAHFTRSGFRAEPVEGGMVEVALDDAPGRRQERLEIALHLRVWQAMNPGAQAMVAR
jgi:hypothetical protein